MISVVTSITGGKDTLIENQCKGNARWIAFLGRENLWNSKDWEIKLAYAKFNSARRNSRIHKILIHKYVDTQYSLWLDGNLQLLVPPQTLIEKYLKNHDIAVFKHPTRDCIYAEATECAKRGLDNVETIIDQAREYEVDGYPKHRGLGEGMFILRRHTPKVEAFDNAWWAEYCRHSVRDQISFMYALDTVGLRCNFIDEQFLTHKEEGRERWIRGGIIEIVPHLTPQYEV
jgi:hypothetical protein